MKEPKVIKVDFHHSQYYPELVNKNQIDLHHTVSDPHSHTGDVNTFLSDPSRIATCIILGYNGNLYKLFNSQHWGRHLGIKQIELRKHGFKDYLYRNELLDKQSIAIEIDCWGGLILGDNSTKKFGNRLVKTLPGKFYNAYGNVIDVSKNPVEECKWRGYDFFQKYSDAQIDTLAWILPHLMEANEIPNYGLKDGNFDVRLDALKGEPGIFSHSNYRKDKSDLYPDTRIVKMLNSL